MCGPAVASDSQDSPGELAPTLASAICGVRREWHSRHAADMSKVLPSPGVSKAGKFTGSERLVQQPSVGMSGRRRGYLRQRGAAGSYGLCRAQVQASRRPDSAARQVLKPRLLLAGALIPGLKHNTQPAGEAAAHCVASRNLSNQLGSRRLHANNIRVSTSTQSCGMSKPGTSWHGVTMSMKAVCALPSLSFPYRIFLMPALPGASS